MSNIKFNNKRMNQEDFSASGSHSLPQLAAHMTGPPGLHSFNSPPPLPPLAPRTNQNTWGSSQPTPQIPLPGVWNNQNSQPISKRAAKRRRARARKAARQVEEQAARNGGGPFRNGWDDFQQHGVRTPGPTHRFVQVDPYSNAFVSMPAPWTSAPIHPVAPGASGQTTSTPTVPNHFVPYTFTIPEHIPHVRVPPQEAYSIPPYISPHSQIPNRWGKFIYLYSFLLLLGTNKSICEPYI